MRLVSQSLKYSGDLDRLMAGLKGGFAAIVDYLVAEVLSQQSPKMTRLMAATAILDRFCASVCNVLSGADTEPGTGDIDGDEFIARLQRENLFLIPLDTENRWFRYHHLFQKVLQRQLKRRCSSEEIAALHFGASEWFAKNDLIDEGIQHALIAGDMNSAARMVEENRQAVLNTDRWYILEK
jgi:LuxR family maltose regulon positive regulatory protein